ncbi:hypothetical protein BD626DRAFT_420854 [Schizophyllum amplum]|uniref:Protein kinase domain-containing protein n=1 Tax=Schizophyllum amplum TaxID=97359 RepID=A0A550CVZ7_9AGAR|nr:hypothetical protein BD626DRAFT_420854 [Auriculariopsis ampla]
MLADDPSADAGDVACKALCDIIRDVPEISVDDFLDYYMPEAPVDLDKLVDKLAERSRVRVNSKPFTFTAPLSLDLQGSAHWTAYRKPPVKRAQRRGSTEMTIFADLENIAAQVVKCCLELNGNLKQTNVLQSNGSKSLASQIYTSAKPDGIRILLDPQTNGKLKAFWDNAAVTEEYKVAEGDALDNYQKLVWNLFQSLRTDARRRFVMGLTITNTTVRLWHMNRELLVVSKPFDMNKSYRTFADVYARLSFATLEQLGYDHTIEKLHLNLPKDVRYRIWIEENSYITTDILANYAAQDPFGRCTRVFQAYKEDDPRKSAHFAIKDGWLERDRELEYDTYKDIMEEIELHDWTKYSPPPNDIKDYLAQDWTTRPTIDPRHGTGVDRRKFFIPIQAASRVHTEDGRIDDTVAVMADDHIIPASNGYLPIVPAMSDDPKKRTHTSQQSGTRGNEKKRAEPRHKRGCFERKIGARVHHRTVMKLGEPLNKIESIADAYATLQDATYGLFILHQLGYRHRDVSPYNILRHAGLGVLADFEYTKHVSSRSRHSMRTGTPNFMAVEVMKGDFLHSRDQQGGEVAVWTEGESDDRTSSAAAWEYDYAHDLESIYWISLWLVFRHTAQPRFLRQSYNRQAHENTYTKLFPGVIDASAQREPYLTKEVDLSNAIDVLPQAWITALRKPFRIARYNLMEYYQRPDVRQPLKPTMWWLMGHVLCGAGQQLGGDLVPFSFPQRAALLEKETSNAEQSYLSCPSRPDPAVDIDASGSELSDEEDPSRIAAASTKRGRSKMDEFPLSDGDEHERPVVKKRRGAL